MTQPALLTKVVNVERLDRFVEPSSGATTSRSLLVLPYFRQVMFGLDAGQEMSEHTSSFLAIVQVVSGRLRMTVADQDYLLETNAWLAMPPHAPHALTAIEPTRFLLTLVRPPAQ